MNKYVLALNNNLKIKSKLELELNHIVTLMLDKNNTKKTNNNNINNNI